MRHLRPLLFGPKLKNKYKFAGAQSVAACIVVMLTIHARAVALDLDCRRYEQFSWRQIQQGDDPWARRCRLFVNGGTQDLQLSEVNEIEQEIARIYSDIQFGNNLDAFNRAQKWLSQNPDADESSTYNVTNLLMRAAYLLSNDAVAIRAAEHQLRLAQASPSSTRQAIRMRESEYAIVKLPRQKAQPDGALIEANGASHGRIRIQVSIDGKLIDALIDTGAEYSVVPSDLAARLGFKLIDGVRIPFQRIFDEPYYVSLATAPTMKIGDMLIENAYFLVTNQNKDRGSYPHIILGLQFMEQFGRVAFIDRGANVALGDAAPDVGCLGGSGQLFRHNDGIGLSVTLDGELAPARYDTGFPESSAYDAPLAFYAPGRRIRKFSQGSRKIGQSPLVIGAFHKFEFEMDGELVRDRNVLIFRSIDASRKLDFPLTVGGSITRRLNAIVLDFTTMRYAAVKDRNAQVDACLAAASALSQQD